MSAPSPWLPSSLLATWFGAGLLPWAPGTWGSLAAVPCGVALFWLSGPLGLLLATVAVFGVGLWAAHSYEQVAAIKDPGAIVIDEVAGQWIALAPALIGADMNGADVLALWPGWVTAFVAFRLFDIWKPGPVGWADRRGGPMGVMLDDVIAGVFAGIVVMIGAGISHGVLGL